MNTQQAQANGHGSRETHTAPSDFERILALPTKKSPYEPTSIREAIDLAEYLMGSGLMPNGVNNPASLVMIFMRGEELGIGPMRALSGISVNKGKLTISAELGRELLARAGGKGVFTKSTATEASYQVTTRDGRTHTETWTWDRATKAGFTDKAGRHHPLTDDAMWRSYPIEMLRARASTGAIRAICPEALGGFYATEELVGGDADAPAESTPNPVSSSASRSDALKAALPKTEPAPESSSPETDLTPGLAASTELAPEIIRLGARLVELVGPDMATKMREANGIIGVRQMSPAQKLVARDALRVLVEGAEADAAIGRREPTPDAEGNTPWANAPAGQE